jgi:hypothetical protein
MSLIITKETTTIRDEGVDKKALMLKIVRVIGKHTDEAARIVIPENATETLFVGDVYISHHTLTLLTFDVQNENRSWLEFKWFEPDWQQQLLDQLFKLHDRIFYCKHSVGEGFNLLVDGLEQPQPDSVQDSETVQRRRALTLLTIRTPEFKSDIAELRQQLLTLAKHWIDLER